MRCVPLLIRWQSNKPKIKEFGPTIAFDAAFDHDRTLRTVPTHDGALGNERLFGVRPIGMKLFLPLGPPQHFPSCAGVERCTAGFRSPESGWRSRAAPVSARWQSRCAERGLRQLDSSENLLRLARRRDSQGLAELEVAMSEQRIFWDYGEYLGTILAKGDDPLGKLAATVDFERFRPILEKAAGRPRGAKGGRPALDGQLQEGEGQAGRPEAG